MYWQPLGRPEGLGASDSSAKGMNSADGPSTGGDGGGVAGRGVDPPHTGDSARGEPGLAGVPVETPICRLHVHE